MSTLRVISISDYVSHGKNGPSKTHLDPGVVLQGLPQWIIDRQTELYVRIWDSTETAEFKLDRFLSRTYRCKADYMHIGAKRFEIKAMRMMIGLAIDYYDLDEMNDMTLD